MAVFSDTGVRAGYYGKVFTLSGGLEFRPPGVSAR
jgi:hypothetical protein